MHLSLKDIYHVLKYDTEFCYIFQHNQSCFFWIKWFYMAKIAKQKDNKHSRERILQKLETKLSHKSPITCDRCKSLSIINLGFDFKMYLWPFRYAIVKLKHLITCLSWDFYSTKCSDQFQLTFSLGISS